MLQYTLNMRDHLRRYNHCEALAKVVLERTVAAIGLLLLSPVLLTCSAVILVKDGTPVLFSQERIGRFGWPFRLLKFRSMRQSAEGSRITAGGDPRVTPIGRVLRKYKLDELPQLWNV